MSPEAEIRYPLIQALIELVRRQDRGALATLRRGLSQPPGLDLETYRYVIPYLPAQLRPRQEEIYFLLAGLFALWHQGRDQVESDPPPTLGASLSCLKTEENQASLERRLLALLNCHRDDLAVHLRHVVSLLRAKNIPIHWPQLLQDLLFWEHPDARVQRRWARDFWGRQANSPAATAATEAANQS